MRTDGLFAVADHVAEYQRRRDRIANALAQIETALVKNTRTLAAPVSDPFLLLDRQPSDLLEAPSRIQHRQICRKYQARVRHNLKLIRGENAA